MQLLCYLQLPNPGRGLDFLSSAVSFTALVLVLCSVFVSTQDTTPYDPYFLSARCPFLCGHVRSGWARYSDIRELDSCSQTLLFDLNLYNAVDDPTPLVAIRACSAAKNGTLSAPRVEKRQVFAPFNAKASKNATVDIQLLRRTAPNAENVGVAAAPAPAAVAAAAALANSVQDDANGHVSILLAKEQNVLVGVYAGRQIDKQSLGDIIRAFASKGSNTFRQTAAQICNEDSLNTDILGILVDTTGDLASVQESLRDWNDAKCLAGSWDQEETWPDVPMARVPGDSLAIGPDVTPEDDGSGLFKRAICSYTQVVAGDGCWAVANRCGITQEQLVQYNGDPGLCNNLLVGQYVCCSPGELPDFSPQPNPDGTCKTYIIQAGDFCDAIARANSMTVNMIMARNRNTWGWAGCKYLLVGAIICLSEGSPPMPGPIANAVCGPQVPGTERPQDLATLADLNPCPLKACCNVWGQCGITTEFCIPSPADTGAPGSAVPGSNGCISSCGVDIVNNDKPPLRFLKIGYFSGWNMERPCLHMRHFAFGGITDNFQVDVSKLQDMYDEFKALDSVRRVMSFGGWSFSTNHDTFPIFREGVTPAQRRGFAENVVSFINNEGLDGVDFDWEYPGAPDIPGIPPGGPNDGANYLEFLKLVRNALPGDKTLGIAAPASFWYLRSFPIDEIAKVVDYIVFMTYDLHGQWDYGNRYSAEGCPAGDCLRSHVNRTETEYALAMITKAGAPANKVLVGMALYGRSFQMTQAGCHGPDCTFTGPESGATPGKCTGTRGYLSNFEIRDIIATNKNIQQHSDEHGNILVYDGVQWVSWLSRSLYNERVDWVRRQNLFGTVEWALDLDADYGDGGPGDGDNGSGPIFISPDIYDSPDPVISCQPPCSLVFPPWVLPTPTTISMDAVTISYEENWATTTVVSGAVVTTSAASITSTVIVVPPVTTSEIEVWNKNWRGQDVDGGVIWLTSSVKFPAMTLTQTSTPGITRPLATWTFSPAPYPTLPPEDVVTTSPDPPPPGYPSTVRVTTGDPKPTCRPGQKCGKRCASNCGGGGGGGGGCKFICGCIGPFCPAANCVGLFCPSANCVGTGCSSGGGGGEGEVDCRVQSTVSFCSAKCAVLQYPTSTRTKCRERCSMTITACSATGSKTTSTETLSCLATMPVPELPGDANVPLLGDGGDATKPDPPPVTTPETGLPIPTTPPSDRPYCFREHNGDGRWNFFSQDEANSIIASVCNSADELPPSNTFGYVSRDPKGLVASVTWAKNQDGCAPKAPVPIRRDNWCRDTFRELLFTCNPAPGNEVYGGAFVESNINYGCVRWWIGADSTQPLQAMARGSQELTGSDLQTHLDNLDAMEPELPRLGSLPKAEGGN